MHNPLLTGTRPIREKKMATPNTSPRPHNPHEEIRRYALKINTREIFNRTLWQKNFNRGRDPAGKYEPDQSDLMDNF